MQYDNWAEIRNVNIKWKEHLNNNIVYPSLADNTSRFLVVPLDLIITKDGLLASVKYTDKPTALPQKNQYTKHADFVDQAIHLVHSFQTWVPNSINGAYQETIKHLNIPFFYHERSLTEASIVLNPDSRPFYPNKDRRYEYTIEGRHGCDGMGNVLVIVDEAGDLQDVECLRTDGKTNAKIVIHQLLQLSKWEPATYKGEKVATQMHLRVYV